MSNGEQKGEIQWEVATILDSLQKVIGDPAFSCCLVSCSVAELRTVIEATQIMAHANSSFALADTRQIARAVPLASLMRHSGWLVHRGEKRADCGLCKANSRGTVSLTDQLWKCHRCGAGGDAFAFVMQVQRCDFPVALKLLADYTGIALPSKSHNANNQREMELRRLHRERIDCAAELLADMERSVRLSCRDKIHECDRILAKPGPWDTAQWQRAKWAHALQHDFLLPEYTLAAFGSMAERVQYVLASDAARADICAAIFMAGGVRTDSGHFMELMQ